MRTFTSCLVILLCLVSQVATQSKPLVKEWLEKDLSAIKQVKQLTEQRFVTPDAAAEALGARNYSTPEDLGFGGGRFDVSTGFGYSKIQIVGYTYKGKLFRYRVLFGDSMSWKQVREHIVRAWNQEVGLPFKENEDSIYHEVDFPDVLTEYKAEIERNLGSMQAVPVPASTRPHYESLTSPYENSIVGFSGCGAGGVTPWGKESLDFLTGSREQKLLENILRGYNPGGRVYALVEFSRMKEKNERSPDVRLSSTMKRVASSDTKIFYCKGGTIELTTAGGILKDLGLN